MGTLEENPLYPELTRFGAVTAYFLPLIGVNSLKLARLLMEIRHPKLRATLHIDLRRYSDN